MGVRRLLRGIGRRLRPRVIRPSILMYHRVTALKHDPWALAVDPEVFEQQIRYIREHRLPMTVDEMVRRLRQGDLPTKAIGITFDDAYLDNLVHAKPILARYGVPGTVFVPTGLIGRTVPFWWDELATMILECPQPMDCTQRCGEDEVVLHWGQSERGDDDPAWRGWAPPQSQRQTSYVALWSRMQKTTTEEREEVMSSLRERFAAEIDPLGVPMTKTELADLVEGGVVRLGAHSVHHASLSDISPEESRAEIRGSQAQCRDFTTEPVDGFAYPYGNMSPGVCQEVEAAGFAWACAAEAGFLDGKQTDYFRLPRIPAPNVAGQAFTMALAG